MRLLAFFLACCSLLAEPSVLRAQFSVRDAIRSGAEAMATFSRTQQDEKLVDVLYPPMVEKSGGRERLLTLIKESHAQLAQAGFKTDSVEIGEFGDPIEANGKQFIVVPQIVNLTGPKVKLTGHGYLLAVSSDKGKTWGFVDGSGFTPETMRQEFPELPATLRLPERQPPKVTPIP